MKKLSTYLFLWGIIGFFTALGLFFKGTTHLNQTILLLWADVYVILLGMVLEIVSIFQ